MMRAQYFVYTRNRDIDYRAIFSPSEEFCPKETRKKFLKEIKGLIDIETYDDPLNTPRWLYSCSNGLILFGVGIMNSELSDLCNTDFFGRPIRGFFGIVMQYSPVSTILPMDLEFFRLIYQKHIEPIWDCDKEHLPNQAIDLDIDIQDGINAMRRISSNVTLNYQKGRCVILGNVNTEDVFGIALTSSQDITIVTGFNDKKHAFAVDSEYQYMNAIVNGVFEREEKLCDVKEEQKVVIKQKLISIPPDIPLQPKKDSRLKLFIGVILLLTISLLFMNRGCQKNQKSQEPLVSGDSIQMINPHQK